MEVKSVLLAASVLVVPLRVWTVLVPQGAAAYARFPLVAQAGIAMIFAWLGFVAWRGRSRALRLWAIATALVGSTASAYIQFRSDPTFGGWVFWASLSGVLLWCWWKEMEHLAQGLQSDA